VLTWRGACRCSSARRFVLIQQSVRSSMISNAQVVRGPQLQLRAYAWVSMLFFMGALTHVMGGSEGEPGPASFLYQPIAAAIYLVAGAYLFCAPGYRRNIGSYLLHDKWMTLSLLIVLASTFW